MVILHKHVTDEHFCSEKVKPIAIYGRSPLFSSLSSSSSEERHIRDATNFPSALSQQQSDKMRGTGENYGQQTTHNHELHKRHRNHQFSAHNPDPEDDSRHMNRIFVKKECPVHCTTHSNFVGDVKRNYCPKYRSSNRSRAHKKWNNGNQRIDYSNAEATTAAAENDKEYNNAFNNRQNPVICTRNGNGQCDDGQNRSLAQSNSQSEQNNEWLSAELFCSCCCCVGGGGGENNLIMESGINTHSNYRGIKTKLLLSSSSTSPSASSLEFKSVNKSDIQVEKQQQPLSNKSASSFPVTLETFLSQSTSKSSSSSSCNSSTTTVTKYSHKRSNKNGNNVIIISSTATVSNLFRPLFNFILLTSFLLNCFNCCDVVQGEILSSHSSTSTKRLDNFLRNRRNNNYHGYENNIERVSLPTYAESSSSPSENNNQHRSNNSLVLNNTLSDDNKEVDNNIYSASLGKVENERKLNKTSSATREKDLKDLLSQPMDGLDKKVLLKTVWDALTPEEIRGIFGHSLVDAVSSAFTNTVPNFDITKPKLTHLHPRHPHVHVENQGRRKRRSTLNDTTTPTTIREQYEKINSKVLHQPSKKLINLEGFGRQFTINIQQNQKLLDPYFVHLHRHENRSEILPYELVRKQLGCFYHGSATHQGNDDHNIVEQGAVAMSLCGGMKGFILPGASTTGSDDSKKFHYVIHPLPNRLLKSALPLEQSSDQEKDKSSYFDGNVASDNEEGHNRHHIIFRRPGIPFSKLAPTKAKQEQLNVHKNKKDDNSADGSSDKQVIISTGRDNNDHDDDVTAAVDDGFPTCMHHETIKTTVQNGQESRYQMKYDFKNIHNNNDNDYSHYDDSGARINANDELDPASQQHQQQEQQKFSRMEPIILSTLYDESGHSSSSINDLELLTDEERMRLVLSASSPTFGNEDAYDIKNTGHNFRRQKRSTSFDTETIDPFTYKPNAAPDSYWIQFRDRSGGALRSSSTIPAGTNSFASGSRRLSSQFSYEPGGAPSRFASSGPSSSFQPSFWHPNSPPLSQARTAQSRQHNLPSRPARGSRYDEIPTAPEYDDTGVAGSDTTWSKGILVFESSASDEDRNYPGKDVPFYTKNNANKRKTPKGISTTSSVVASTSSTSSSSSNTRSFDWFGPGSGVSDSGSSASSRPAWDSQNKNQTSTKYSVSAADSPARKGRRDDGVFGDRWKSSLDSEIIWADRSNEISNKGKFEDLSNVKDRPHSHLTIETAVFVDKDLYKHMQQNFPDDTQGEVTRIVLAMINAVQLLYQDPSLGHRVDFVLKRLEVLESDPPTLIRPYDIDRFLTNFCKWQRTENPASDADPMHWDHALILTGLDLYVVHQSGKISNQVVGLAPVAGMCTRSSSCTVNEGRHFESVFVVAHEIGHNLGMRHDGPQAENNCDPTSHIMSPTLGSGKITWSPCSKKYLDLFLESKQSTCLFDKAKSERWLDHDADGRLPGERFDADRQCVLKYGRGSFHATQQPLEDVCRDLHCRREFFTWTSHPALDGTRCSVADDMWCRAGKCVPKITGPSSTSLNSYELSGLGGSSSSSNKNDGFSGGSNHLPGSETAAYVTQKSLDGGWGKWSPFTDCSSACLYSDDGTLTMGSNGVRLAARRCDSPRPENGGRQCSGPDRRYKSCTAHKICTKNPTRTTVSQYATEVCSRAAQVDTELTGRGYMSSSNDQERACSVWCETNENSGPRSRGWSFPDGTACKLMSLPKSAQSLCVAGKCQEFTCNPYSHFRLSEDECILTSSNDVIPSSNKNSNSETWFNAGTNGAGGVVKINHRSGKVGWTDWEVQTECKLACLAPAKGLQLVKRQCASDDALCTGLSLSVRLCKPDKYTVQTNGCSRLQTPFEYATKVCSKYAGKVSGLSGIGMQLSPTKDDADRPCRIGCQDASIAYRFYMVNGEEGWFPPGTDCSRGDQDKKAYCMAGKCVDFGDDDTPLYQLTNNLMGSLFQQSSRNKRQAVYNIMEPLKTEPGMDESSLKQLVHKFSQETGNYPSIVQRSRGLQSQRRSYSGANSIDFSKPILIQSSSPNYAYSGGGGGGSNNNKNIPYNNYAYPNTNDIFLTKSKNALGDPYSSYKNYYNINIDDRSNRARSLDMEVVDVKQEWEAQNNKNNENPSSSNYAHRSGQGYEQGNSESFRSGHSQPVEGSFYEWRKIVSDCSVVCGTGIQEVIVQCVSGDTVVNDSLCQGRPRPGYSGYINCHKVDCSRSSTDNTIGSDKGSHIWNWIQSILPPKNMSST